MNIPIDVDFSVICSSPKLPKNLTESTPVSISIFLTCPTGFENGPHPQFWRVRKVISIEMPITCGTPPFFWTQIPVATLTPRLAQRRSAALGSVGRTTPACSRLRGPHFYRLGVNHPKNGGLKGCGFIWLSLLLLLFTTVTSVPL